MSYNTDGKTNYICSCGIKANLEIHEIPQWLYVHGSHYAGVKHELTELKIPDQTDVMRAILQLAQASQAGKK
jgi:hypothetical protein